MCNLVRNRTLKSRESSEKSSGENRVKSCHVCGISPQKKTQFLPPVACNHSFVSLHSACWSPRNFANHAMVRDCVCNPHIQESPHPRAPESPKSLKKDFPGLPVGSVKKVSKKCPNTDFVVFFTLFRVIWHFFDTFLALRAGRPGNTILRLFGDFGPRGPRDSCICSNRKSGKKRTA